jgi:hypothetical protein
MPRYRFDWTITGTNEIEAGSLAEAQIQFDALSVEQLYSSAVQQDFCQDAVRVSTPDGFGEVAEGPDGPEPYQCSCGARYAEAVSVDVCEANNHGRET